MATRSSRSTTNRSTRKRSRSRPKIETTCALRSWTFTASSLRIWCGKQIVTDCYSSGMPNFGSVLPLYANATSRFEISKRNGQYLGYGFGMGWRKLYMLNQESFDSQSEAKRVMDTLNGLFPRACKWRDEVRMKAHEQGFLMSRAGCIRWFWEVFKWDGSKLVPGGDDSESAVAFLPANDAFCHIKDAMLRLEQGGHLERFGLINQIHDDLMFLCPDESVDEAIATVTVEMERPSATLIDPVVAPEGLVVEVGIAKGKRWDLMTKV